MINITNFCITLNPEHENLIRKLNYISVGLGQKKFSKESFSDNTGNNISFKNPYYGEYTFHYWLWKNYINKIETEWIGFCQYRKFFVKKEIDTTNLSFEELKEASISKISHKLKDYDCVLGKKFSVENYKLMKILKNHCTQFLLNPQTIFLKKKEL